MESKCSCLRSKRNLTRNASSFRCHGWMVPKRLASIARYAGSFIKTLIYHGVAVADTFGGCGLNNLPPNLSNSEELFFSNGENGEEEASNANLGAL